MANSKLIIVEGPQGAGKTTITDFIKYTIPYTNLYRLHGSNDSSPSGKIKSVEMYTALLDYIEKLQNKNINLLFDRTFFTEYVFCNLGFKEYTYEDAFNEFMARLANFDYEIYYITLYLSDINEFEDRLNRSGKGATKYGKYSFEGSIKQQEEYLAVAKQVEEKYGDKIHVVNIDTCIGLDGVKEEILKLLQ